MKRLSRHNVSFTSTLGTFYATLTKISFGGYNVLSDSGQLRDSSVFLPRGVRETAPTCTLAFTTETERDSFITFIRQSHVKRHSGSTPYLQFQYPAEKLSQRVQIPKLDQVFNTTTVVWELDLTMVFLGDNSTSESPVSKALNSQDWWYGLPQAGDVKGHTYTDDQTKLQSELLYMHQPHIGLS